MLEWREGSELRESGRRHLGNIIVRASLRRYMTASSCTNSLRYMSLSLSDHQPTWTSRFHHPTQLYQQPFEGLGGRTSSKSSTIQSPKSIFQGLVVPQNAWTFRETMISKSYMGNGMDGRRGDTR